MKKNLLFIFIFIWVPFFAFTQNQKTAFISKDSLKSFDILYEKWKFTTGDDSSMALPSYDDSKWIETRTTLNLDSKGTPAFTGICWFRYHFTTDSTATGRPLAMYITHFGASQIYLDGKLIKSYGLIQGQNSSVYFDPQELPFIFTIPVTKEHLLAVRYANYDALKNNKVYNHPVAGFRMTIGETANLIGQKNLRSTVITFILMILCGFFFSFCLIHLFMYLLNRTIRSNLYFSLFMFSLAFSFMIFFICYVSTTPSFQLKSIYISTFVFVISCISLSGFINELFHKKKWRFKILLVTGFIIMVLRILDIDFFAFLTVALIISVSFEALFTVIFAIIKKVKGAKIIGTGILFFTLFVLSVYVILITSKTNVDLDDSTIGGRIFIVCLALAIISIPVSMAVYLAWNFSFINKSLALQLDQVQVLSEKSIEQEKEKQKILTTQNEVLEQQVTLRTSEVVSQKELVESKNKEITDSIEYALRIQSAILPPRKIIKQHLENSFILYKPKDIVAGDFYWMETVQLADEAISLLANEGNKDNASSSNQLINTSANQLILFAACDCTGHGVPGAMVSVVCHNALNRAVREFGLTSPAAILDKTAEIVIENFSKSEEDIKDGMDISLVCLKYSNQKSKVEIEWAGANNPLWIVKKMDNGKLTIDNDDSEQHSQLSIDNYQLSETKADKQPIGMNEDHHPFTNHTFTLNSGDTIYLFTDGFADQFCGENKLTRKKFKDLILSIQHIPLPEQRIALEKFIDDYRKDTEQTDDILVMGVRV